MADIRKIVNVFLASPSDLKEERRTTKRVVDEFNSLLAKQFGYQVELVGWEDTVASYGRPQETINRDLVQCDLFLGLMWKRWGTPPSASGPYTSGFEEEFRRSVDRRAQEGRPEISLFFKEIEADRELDAGPELQKVLSFKNSIIDEKQLFFEQFNDIDDFEKKIRRLIITYIINIKNAEVEKISDQSQLSPADGVPVATMSTDGSILEPIIYAEGAKFLRDLVSRMNSDTAAQPITAPEAARFRLFGTMIGTAENDDATLGAHDANALFIKSPSFVFEDIEIGGLLISGLENYLQENLAVWRWYVAKGGFDNELLPLYATYGSAAQRVGALTAMRVVSQSLDISQHPARDKYLNNWLGAETPSAVKIAALKYLGDFGVAADLPPIQAELERSDTETTAAATDALIRILLRDSRAKALLALYELQPSYVSRDLLDAIFVNDATLNRDVLIGGVTHKSPLVRRVTAELLASRNMMPPKIAEELLVDGDARVRLAALQSLILSGRTFSEEEAEGILVKPEAAGLLGAFGGFQDTAGNRCLEHFKIARLRSMKERDLEALASEETIFDRSAEFVLTDRQFTKRGDDLRRAIKDQYKTQFSLEFEKFAKRYGNNSDFIKKTGSLELHLRQKFTRQALNIICRHLEKRDLTLIRDTLRSGFVSYSLEDIAYFKKFGEWEDIPLILAAVEYPLEDRQTLLGAPLDVSRYRSAAKVIYSIGKNKLPELLGHVLIKGIPDAA
jgi:hypothetical protein